MQELDHAAFYDLYPVERRVLLLELAEHVGDHHLVRLFVQLPQLHRSYLVIPPLHIGRVVDSEE